MSKLLRLVQSPFQPPIDAACGLTFKIGVPYSKDAVTVIVNASVEDYKEKDGNKDVEVRQFTFSQYTSDTKEISLDFKSNNTNIIQNGDKQIEVKLMKIDTEKIEGQDFLAFELFVSDIE